MIKKQTETSISGTAPPKAGDIENWLKTIPFDATLRLRESRTHPGEFGVEPWRITASWEDEDGMISGRKESE